MKICVINPNTSSAMTNNIKSSAVSVVSDEVEINCINPGDGPESIEGYYDEVFGSVGVCIQIKAAPVDELFRDLHRRLLNAAAKA